MLLINKYSVDEIDLEADNWKMLLIYVFIYLQNLQVFSKNKD